MPHKIRKHITVYNDTGTAVSSLTDALRASFYGAALGFTTGAEVKQGNAFNDNTLAFFLPGIVGDNSPYSDQLGDDGNLAIRQYVQHGGVFVGICAGAYYAANRIVFDAPWRDAPKTREPKLDFFNGVAKGPIKELARHSDEEDFSDCTVAKINFNDVTGARKTTGIAYGNGPILYPDNINDKNLRVLARYEDVKGKPIAIAARNVGRGLAVFVGVLPYIPPLEIGSHADQKTLKGLRELSEALAPHEQGRQDVWDMLMKTIKQHNIDLGKVQPRPPRPSP